MIHCIHSYEDIISLENLLEAWKEFVKGKRSRKDIQEFERDLMYNLNSLHRDLVSKTYVHSEYEAFNITDPKPRNIHKASVRDRLLHHAIYRKLYSYFDKRFISDSYSCRLGKGTYKALQRFKEYTDKSSKNNTKTLWVLKCDIRKFFASIDQEILFQVLSVHIRDENVIWLIQAIVKSFYSTSPGKGLPLGNLTSQLLVNVYMNEFDQWVKNALKVKYYIRYADDFVIMDPDKDYLNDILKYLQSFLDQKLKLYLHPDKVFIKTLASGVDFLGWVHFPQYRVLRTVTKRRMFVKLRDDPREEVSASYLGLLKHGNAHKLQSKIREMIDVDNSA